MGVLLTQINEYRICELTRTVHIGLLSLNKKYITEFREHCIVCRFDMLENARPEFTKLHLAAGLCPDPLGELTALPQTLSSIKRREGREM